MSVPVPGQYEDEETGLYYNRFRYYSPDEGMYTQQDPVGLAGGTQLYGYVSDPLTYIDPFGLSSDYIFRGDDLYKLGIDIGQELGKVLIFPLHGTM
ncbi:RHS repeat-associated core domain-containing protein [Paenibacillus sp. A3]|uniref:RHS repeat-associated core domain-containing protein n=1 Tax=Paenibacillus sp. A3 TaxID=1337054 RepID=UPI0006D5A4B4|nr:RHS repeat-associated core domain-containing protein [Paenibacillus sp. A3]